MSEAKDLTEIRKQIQQRSAEQKLTRRSTMSVPEMRKLLGLKKTDSYWLVHKNFFKTEVIGGMMRIDLVSFEKWYAKFVKEAKEAGFENLKGHRTVGGMRASIYNAMPIEGVEKLVEFMKKFEAENA